MSVDFDRASESETCLRTVHATLSVAGIWNWDHLRRVVVYDRGAAHYLAGDPNLADRELAADRAMATIHPEDRAWLREYVVKSVYAGGVFLAEYRVILQGGDIRRILSRGRTERSADGSPLRSWGILIDVTEPHDPVEDYVVEAQGGTLARAADQAMAIKRILDTESSPTLSLIVDMLLLQLGREIARTQESGPANLH